MLGAWKYVKDWPHLKRTIAVLLSSPISGVCIRYRTATSFQIGCCTFICLWLNPIWDQNQFGFTACDLFCLIELSFMHRITSLALPLVCTLFFYIVSFVKVLSLGV